MELSLYNFTSDYDMSGRMVGENSQVSQVERGRTSFSVEPGRMKRAGDVGDVREELLQERDPVTACRVLRILS